ncbi:MAG: 50S ribosome-binding GTPase [Planctomycetes bacterium]|nr:50S ribosome-binding GTPase [Planctomycetota bacterium]
MIGDTIFAVASPPGVGERGLIRLSGPAARRAAEHVLDGPIPPGRGAFERTITIAEHAVSSFVLSMPGPGSFTGEDVVELHLPGSPLLLGKVQESLLEFARPATPGEFSRRAFENGRLTLAEAEAIADLIHAADREQLRFAVDVLAGGLGDAVDAARAAVQDGLALLEVGLDFDELETGAVERDEWLELLDRSRDLVRRLAHGVPEVDAGGDVVLLGAANAGKSSLCNALAGADLLVGERPGTTRDVLTVEVGDATLLDAPGDLGSATGVDVEALALRDRIAGRAGAALLVVDARGGPVPRTELPILGVVRTKSDLLSGRALVPLEGVTAPEFRVSSVTGEGLEALRRHVQRAAGSGRGGGAARFASSVRRAADALDRAIESGRHGEPEEVVAAEVGQALACLDEVHGRSSPEALLDRVFGGFCLGK